MKIDINEVYEIGFRHGQSLFDCNIYDVSTKNLLTLDEFKERIRAICWEADDGYRQYSPFEFFCRDMNDAPNSEEAWESYEKGIGDGVEAAIEEFCSDLNFEEYINDR